ncbi:hypothetical protein ACFL1B_02330 [Nanoarchaeota archaeon]
MVKSQKPKSLERWFLLLLAIGFLISFALYASGAPQGASILTNNTMAAPADNPDSRADAGGTITVLTLDNTQQDTAWKAYVGNVSGRLTLDDGSGYTIYDWSIIASAIEGEVYVARNGSVGWTNISCASQATINSEQTTLNMVSTDADSLNQTFNRTVHATMQVGINTIANSSCRSTATYVNDTAQTNITESTSFQEILLQDANSNMVYATPLVTDIFGFKGGAEINITYDFQLLVAEDDQAGTPTTYYFYLEISG